MSEHIFKNVAVNINTVALKATKVSVEDGNASVDVLKMGDTAGNKRAGIKEQKITASFIQDFSSGNVHATLSAALANCASGGTANVVVKPDDSANSAINPWVSLPTATLLSYNPIPSVTVGEKGEVTVTFETTGTAFSYITT